MRKMLIAIVLTLTATTTFAHMEHSGSDHDTMNNNQMSGGTNMEHSEMMDMDGMSAVGMPATGAKPDKVVHVILDDNMRITFKKEVNIQPDDIVQFVVINTGKIVHEFSIGSEQEQLEHREMMKTANSHHQHDSGSTVTVAPGKAKQLIWHFHGERNVEFACNIPGHAEAGMIKKIKL
ncbi:copper-resistant cuproprotein CopI [Vibrio mangrovi]|uniref:Copper-binding protein n=1 Tax=Vibrio mangrovi TaxID=474394 RepID=A0A1Y6IPG7_9VIBR|nr:copper-binding protein [Vibrio mangrovi]MDW6004240.1 copper-binding protein [Vibrio mangrovi]SMR98961.1 hypothetical protein VIM7927_00181 [Vibrio mangrovi]